MEEEVEEEEEGQGEEEEDRVVRFTEILVGRDLPKTTRGKKKNRKIKC